MNSKIMKIKKVKSRDLRKIIKLEKKVFKENAFSKKLMKEIIEQNFIFHKLETEGFFKKIIGFIVVILDMKDRANLINFVINSKHQGNGYGTLLLQNTLSVIASKPNRIKKVILNVNTKNSNAIQLYEKFGFKIIKIIENYYQNQEAAYLMELDIRSENA